MSHHVLMFYDRFVKPIRAGTKDHTIRPPRKRPIVRGDTLSLRCWSSKAYRSPQAAIIPDVVCSAVAPIRIVVDWWDDRLDVEIGGERLTHDEVCAFVRSDGFRCVSDMVGYYREKKTESVDGIIIYWEPPAS